MITTRRQVGGDHYEKHSIMPWDIIDEYSLNFYEGNIIKYILREKGSKLEDLKKAAHYLEKLISIHTKDGYDTNISSKTQ